MIDITDVVPLVGLLSLILLWRHEAVTFRGREVLNCMLLRVGSFFVWAAVLAMFLPVKVNLDFAPAPLWRYAAAGLEDVLFVFPALVLPRPWRYVFLAFSTLVFASAHMYQGDFPALVKLPFVLVSYLLAARFGILTTVVAHSLHDIGCWAIERALR